MGHVGRFTAVDAVQYPRGMRVVVRTGRGLEVGEILAPAAADEIGNSDGSILRGMTTADDLLETRLQKNKQAALAACVDRMATLKPGTVLLDAEHTFDGRQIYFYFLGEVTPEIEAFTSELAEVYESQAQLRKFAETLTAGCGPGCGTEAATGSGCSSCGAGCSVAKACGTSRGARN